MPIAILMPALSPTMTEGNLVRWLVKDGDVVKSGQVIAEIETDKATMEVEATDSGTILKTLVPAKTNGVQVNSLIAVLAEKGEEKMSPDEAIALVQKKMPKAAVTAPASAGVSAPTRAMPAVMNVSSGARVFASPLAKRLAEQRGLDLRNVRGTGPNGRIVKADVETAQVGGMVGRGLPDGIDAKDYATKLGMAYTAIPNSSVRKIIAKRLQESKLLVPHFYLTVDCDIDALLSLRKTLNESAGDAKISVNDFVIKAVALALQKVPAANASWTDDAILQYKNVDISIAVAAPSGLVTPIIKKADTKTLAQISAEMKDLAIRARDNKLKPEEFQGGGFSISNLGMFGIKQFSAIINPPQSCILAVGAGEQRAVVKDGKLAIATVMTCTLSVDHRSVDGSVGAEFLAAFKPLIENPKGLV